MDQQPNTRKRVPWYARLYLWATYRLYNELAWAYDLAAWSVSAGQWARWRRMALDYVKGPRVLEIGFGTGELLLEMARRGVAATGLEYSPAMQRVTGRKMRRRGLWRPRVRAAAQAMPFVDGTFDAVISTFPANYIAHPATLVEISRMLRSPDLVAGISGGRLIIVGLTVTANHPLLYRLLPMFFGRPGDNFEPYWQDALTAAGLKSKVIYRRDGLVTLPIVIGEAAP